MFLHRSQPSDPLLTKIEELETDILHTQIVINEARRSPAASVPEYKTALDDAQDRLEYQRFIVKMLKMQRSTRS